MRKFTLYTFCILMAFVFHLPASAQGWPTNYGGVMLQGFYWDSYSATQWTTLESQADELSQYFSLVWLPQSGNCNGTSMGYDDYYWFPGNNHYTSSFGTETQLRSLIATFKSKGIGCIADVVINHRKNQSNWVDFPAETYQGVTYQLQSTDICADDDGGDTKTWADSNGYSLSSNNDTGEGWDGMRDLDHYSANVQTNVKAYLNMLLNDLGYIGFRYDMVKGYDGSFTGLYNSYANPTYSVGEYWDGNKSTVENWLNATKVDDKIQSAAFDFPFRYTVRDAVNNGNWSKLTEGGMVTDADYARYAVTFVENHDTEYRSATEQQDPIKKDTLAANAYLLAMPGTPCVFLKHWIDCKQDIKMMINARQAAGVTNTSNTNKSFTSGTNYQVIRTQGSNGYLLAAIGSSANDYVPTNPYQEIINGYHYRYFLEKKAEIAWVDLPSGEYADVQQATLTAVSASSDAKLVYTTDGSDPTTSSTAVASGTTISLTMPCTLKVALLTNGTVGSIITRQYTVKQPDPVVTPTNLEGKIFAYFEKPANWSSPVYVWVWNTGQDGKDYLGTSWPGVPAVKQGVVANGNELWLWMAEQTTAPDNIIFSHGSSQTKDLTFVNGGYYTNEGYQSTVTGIRNIHADEVGTTPRADNLWYNLMGQPLNGEPTQRGIYIYNGKKIIRK